MVSRKARRDRKEKSTTFSYYNNLFFKGNMELHVVEIIIILLGVVKQHVRFI